MNEELTPEQVLDEACETAVLLYKTGELTEVSPELLQALILDRLQRTVLLDWARVRLSLQERGRHGAAAAES